MKKSESVCVSTDKTKSTRVIQIEDYIRWVSNHLLKAADRALRLNVIALFEDAKTITQDSEDGFVSSIFFCETITHNTSDPISKATNQRPQDNKL